MESNQPQKLEPAVDTKLKSVGVEKKVETNKWTEAGLHKLPTNTEYFYDKNGDYVYLEQYDTKGKSLGRRYAKGKTIKDVEKTMATLQDTNTLTEKKIEKLAEARDGVFEVPSGREFYKKGKLVGRETDYPNCTLCYNEKGILWRVEFKNGTVELCDEKKRVYSRIFANGNSEKFDPETGKSLGRFDSEGKKITPETTKTAPTPSITPLTKEESSSTEIKPSKEEVLAKLLKTTENTKRRKPTLEEKTEAALKKEGEEEEKNKTLFYLSKEAIESSNFELANSIIEKISKSKDGQNLRNRLLEELARITKEKASLAKTETIAKLKKAIDDAQKKLEQNEIKRKALLEKLKTHLT
jgi:hypothetical protein